MKMDPNAHYIIAIDPDTVKSGIAVYDPDARTIHLGSSPFFDLVNEIRFFYGNGSRVCIEAGHKTTTNFHITGKDSRRTAAKKHYEVGRCHQIGILLTELCRKNEMCYEEVFPLEKCWKGPDRKITHQELISQLEHLGITIDASHLHRSNQEERDAALIAITRPESHRAFNQRLLSKL